MSRLEGMSHEQIAQVLGIHKITVAQYIFKSRSFLKSYLKEHTDDTIITGHNLELVLKLNFLVPSAYFDSFRGLIESANRRKRD